MTEYISVPGTDIRTQWVLVTPQMAKEFLEANTENRSKREKHVSRIATDMAKGRYQVTHQGLAFDDRGIMIDGQHRCHALVNSETSQWMLVTTGLPKETKNVVDNGAKRRAADFMPGQFKDLKAAAIRILLGIERLGGNFSSLSLAASLQQVTNSAIQEDWDRWSEDNFNELAHLAQVASKRVVIGPAGLLAAALAHPKVAKEFLEGIATMTGLEYGDPRLALLKFRGGNKRVQTPNAAFVAMKTAKAFNDGKRINVLKYTPQEVLKIDIPDPDE
jgi:hypothetical protein